MGFGFGILFFACLIRALIVTEAPFVCAGIFTTVAIVRATCMFGLSLHVAVTGIAAFAASSLYFWLLDRFNDSLLWWLILIVGLPVIALL